MSDSDTYLDSILEGLTTPEEEVQNKRRRPATKGSGEAAAADTPVEPPPATSPQRDQTDSDAPVSALDGILDGLTTSAPSAPPVEAASGESGQEVSGTSDSATAPEPDAHISEPVASTADIQEVNPGVLIGTGDLDLATPQDILGLPPEPTGAASHMELAHEVNAVATAPAPQETEARTRWESNHSFAAIARDISATVEVAEPETHRRGGKADGEHASFYVRTRRRRRQKRVNRVTVTQVIGLVLLLVLGLGGEYEYVSKHASPPAPAAVIPSDLTTKLPVVRPTPVPGTLFHFVTRGTAQSAPFRVTRPVTLQASARCSHPTAASNVEVGIRSGGYQVITIPVDVRTTAPVAGKPAALKTGTYVLVVHAPSTCTWSVQGRL
jgi:hypothetical protein